MPLYLLILAIVMAVGMVVVLGWLGTLEGQRLGNVMVKDSNGNADPLLFAHTENNITFYVSDQDGEPMEGVQVILHGCGVDRALITDERGEASVNINPVPPGGGSGVLEYKAVHGGESLGPYSLMVQG